MKESLVKTIDIINTDDSTLIKISRDNLLALNLDEMKTIQDYYKKQGRNPTDIELETIAQTWSEHCKHKTLTGTINLRCNIHTGQSVTGYTEKAYNNLLKETIFRVTKELDKKWCISVFEDNAGIIDFDKDWAVAFKVETHNHPSALEPYGGAGTGIGGVIRDILGVGLGGKPILNTDVFCFGAPDTPYEKLPAGVLHPKRIFKGVVSGVRDYGNRMGIPTANGTIVFDEGYTYNPLVYCGTVGIMKKNKCFKKVNPGDYILAVGGRTGRDGIHGATFSSLALDKDTPLSPVQIGNPIMEKKVTDTVLQACERNLYTALTDCGAGGFSSAVGELGKNCGVKVYLERVPLKYEGLLPWEIWVSEAQERMVLAVRKDKLEEILKVFHDENVETTVLGEFTDTGRLEVFYKDEKICDLDMQFLHEGLPKRTMIATFQHKKFEEPSRSVFESSKPGGILKDLLSSLNICSKEWVVRQYDHEVQGQTVVKPFHGKYEGPGDACVMQPLSTTALKSKKVTYRGIAVACGINPQYGKIDSYWMTASAIDEALRNIVSVGGDPEKTALLDNFCWGSPNIPEQLGDIVRAAEACYDIAKVFSTPFISGKDSLNNDYNDEKGNRKSIPGTMLISAISIVQDIRKCVTMDIKKPGNLVYLLGETKDELGGSQLYNLYGFVGNNVPKVNPQESIGLMKSLHKAINAGIIESCHDCSEGGLGVALAEMSFAGGYGVEINLSKVKYDMRKVESEKFRNLQLLFSESNSRFVVEITQKNRKKFEKILRGKVFSCIGKARKDKKFVVCGINKKVIINENIDNLKASWQKPFSNF